MSEHDFRQLSEIEANERWLAHMPEVRASDSAIAAAKLAARRELAAMSASAPRRTWRAWTGSLAAAAAIALASTVAWRSHQTNPATPVAPQIASTYSATVVTTEVNQLDEQLESLEAWSADASWETSGSDLYDAFKEVLQDDSGVHNGTM